MTVKRLRELIADLPDTAPVLLSAPDHEYIDVAAVSVETARRARDGTWTEDQGEENTPTEEFGRPVDAVLIR